MSDSNRLRIRDLAADDAIALLARNHVGRIAFSFHDRVDIEPIGYVYDDGWIYGRTTHGSKLATVRHNRWVAFQVDEVRSILSWRSVVVHGGLYVMSERDTPADARGRERAITLFRALDPDAFTEHDPVGFRDVLFRIATQEIVGREAEMEADA
ncbi:MAG TPA: pyridoxamine 5'-phosphate oxidase family protein [Gemmatimonadaceae bacterium]|nr:pyridoxamine 5'-phosphate oxidase family protein [Gemmatimonadaceae bacterium]